MILLIEIFFVQLEIFYVAESVTRQGEGDQLPIADK